MLETLCGLRSCPSICQRVCHCPAGLARSHELLGMLRNSREMSKSRASLYSVFPPERWGGVEFIPEARLNFGVLNQPEHGRPSQFYPTHNYRQAPVPYTRQLKSYTAWAFLTGLLVFMGIVILLGLAINGGDFVPDYEPPQIYFQEWK